MKKGFALAPLTAVCKTGVSTSINPLSSKKRLTKETALLLAMKTFLEYCDEMSEAFVSGGKKYTFGFGNYYCDGKKISKEAIKANLAVLCVSGALIGFNWIFLFESFNYTTVATGTLCYYMAPVFVILIRLMPERKKYESPEAAVCFSPSLPVSPTF